MRFKLPYNFGSYYSQTRQNQALQANFKQIEGELNVGPRIQSFRYDFTTFGGAIGSINLVGKIPNNALVLRAYIDPIVDLTSGGAATVRVGYTGVDHAFIGNTPYNHATFDGPDSVTVAADHLPAKMTSDVFVVVTIGGAGLTGGSFLVHVEYSGGGR